MNTMPKRDTKGICEGECRNRQLEGEMERQREINLESIDYPEDYPRVNWASDRDIQPGVFGGHV